jgi:hypothetical protein
MLFISTMWQSRSGTEPLGAIFNFPTTPRRPGSAGRARVIGDSLHGHIELTDCASTFLRLRLATLIRARNFFRD